MSTVFIDNKWLVASFPESFEPIPHAEIESTMGFTYDQMSGMHDAARHMKIIVTWKDNGTLLTKIAREKTIIKQVDKTFAKRYRRRSYRGGSFFERTITGASAPAQGLRFSFSIDGVAQEGEVLVFKHGIRFYTLCYFTHSETAAANRPVYEEIVASIEAR